MDGELLSILRLVTEGGSFALLCVMVLWVMFKGAPKHFANQREINEVMRATLADQRKAHADEREYLRKTQERQHAENVEGLARMARAIAHEKRAGRQDKGNPDDRPREG